MFNSIADRYDLLNRLLSFNQDRRWRRHLVEKIPYRPYGHFLDIATGTGDIVLAAAQTHYEYSRFDGVDISSNMLHGAREKTQALEQKKAIPKIKYDLMSAEHLNYPTASMDCMSIGFGLRNVIDQSKALQEFARVLKTDGVLLILEFFKPKNSFLSRLFRFYFHKWTPILGGWLSDRKAYEYLPSSVEGFQTLQELEKNLLAVGLTIVELTPYLGGACNLLKIKKLGE